MHGSEKERQHGFKDGAIDFTAGSLGQFILQQSMTSNDQILLITMKKYTHSFICVCTHGFMIVNEVYQVSLTFKK